MIRIKKTSLLLLFLSGLLAAGCTKMPQGAMLEAVNPDFQKGMTIACWGQHCLSTADARMSLNRLAESGTRWIALVVTGYQSWRGDSNIRYENVDSPDRWAVRDAVKRARALGFKIMLKPHVDLDDGSWRGDIEPEDVDAWFAAYSSFLLDNARQAAELEIEQLVVGTELVRLIRHEDRWRAVIAAVRDVYPGQLLYAASWNEFESIAFWDALDYIGINAYFPLTGLKDPSKVDLMQGWEFWLEKLEVWQKRMGKEIIFTEIGYTTRDGTNMRPYDFWSRAGIDLQEQADCYEIALRVLPKQRWLKGLYWWYWPTDMTAAAHADGDYSPVDRPAYEALFQAWGQR